MNTQRKTRILIVEDESPIRTGLQDVFTYHGYAVDCAEDGPAGLRKAQGGAFDLILLDIMLPGMDGFEVCNRIREQDRHQPIIMLTAKTADKDIIQGLSLGADDYIAKPFSVTELVLRVKAVLRRSSIGRDESSLIVLGEDLEIDKRNLSGRDRNRKITFTRREMDILEYLDRNSDRPASREELLHRIWGYAKHLNIETRTVDIHIAKLRRKIEPAPAEPRYLVTVRGAGYRLIKG
ncbi:MAG: response regulator transcription factor [Methylococcaceae bacterium]|nr:response regulator transcription factor [Methylococcaceae bacterium]MCI0734227.1 response regulator transcription factor [Methylococcaceae bacterium]